MLTKLYNKVLKDLTEFENLFSNDAPQTIIQYAHDIYHGQNFFYQIEEFVQNFDEEDDYYAIQQTTIEKIINFKDNIISYWINHMYDIRHSERYNLENFDDFVSVLECVINNLEGE